MTKKAIRRLAVPFGLREGKLQFVADVPLGLDCGCTCPECGEPLVARNRDFEGRKRIRHFQHASTSSCSGGLETAVHRMAKDVLCGAASFMLPTWVSGDVIIEPETLSVIGAQMEMPLLGASIRPDLVVHGASADITFDALCVEVRVHHAVDESKRDLLTMHGMDAIEIDLSAMDDETLADSEAFRRAVLEDPDNRRWIHLGNGRYLAERSDKAIIQVADTTVTERVVTTKSGSPFTIREQSAFLVKPGSCVPIRIQIPDETVGEIAEPYPCGLHSISGRSFKIDQRGRLSLRYKTYLDQIQMNQPDTGQPQLGLFEAGQPRGPGFNVRRRAWKGRLGS